MAVAVPTRWGVLVVLVVLAAGGCGSSPAPAATGRLVLDEDFSGSELGPTWGTCHWWAPDGCTILTNDELEWYLPGQVAVADGRLRLTAEEHVTRAEGRRFPYASGMVSSGRPGDEDTDEPRFAFTYGRVEVRFRIPAEAGTWPAIWMLPITNSHLPEIDLLEVHGQEPDLAAMTLHPLEGERERRQARVADLSDGWHEVALDWAPGELTWSIDGDELFRVTGDAVPAEPMYLVANLAVGGDAGAPPADATFPATFLLDSVKVWARP